MAKLITVPTVVFEQNSSEDFTEEFPIVISYYNGTISIEQHGNEINLITDNLKEFCKTIIKHQPEAEKWLSKN